ncbi:MAG: hypothetical protein WB791_06260 [Waddliaceae bacterium]
MNAIPSFIGEMAVMAVKTVFFLAVFFLVSCGANSSERTAHLQYQPDLPVYLDSNLTLSLNQSLPGFSLSSRAKQTIGATLTLTSGQTDLPLFHPPFDLTFLLKSIKIGLQANGAEMVFDSDQMESSLYLSRLSKMIHRPIRIHFDRNFKMESRSHDLNQMVEELPLLQEIDPESLLVELFLHLFSLAGNELAVGQTIQKVLADHPIPAIPQRIDYTVTSIDDYAIEASVTGEIGKMAFQLSSLMPTESGASELVDVSVSGTMKGNIKWNRDNAMLYEMKMQYDSSGTFKIGEWEWMMHVIADLHHRTRLQSKE